MARLAALATWPWTLKFLLAPAIDLLRGPRFGLRGWILASQAGMALTLLPLFWIGLEDARALAALLVGHALAAATQDASIDTWAVHAVPPAERGAINGWMQLGMLVARGLFGGGAILLAERLGQRAVVLLLVAAVAGPALLAGLGLRGARGRSGQALRGGGEPLRARARAYLATLRALARGRATWVGLLYAALAAAGFEGLTVVAGPLLRDRGLDTSSVGLFYLAPPALMAGGALAGGWASDRFGRRRVALLGEVAAALVTIAIGLLLGAGAPGLAPAPLLALLALLYVVGGLSIAALYALLMDLCEPAVAATQFCAFMAAVNLCMVWSGAAMGTLHDHHGYGPAAVVLGCASLAALPLLLALPPRVGVPPAGRA